MDHLRDPVVECRRVEEGDDNLNQLLLVNGLHGDSNLHREQGLVVEFDDYFGGVESVLDRPRNLFAETRYLRVKKLFESDGLYVRVGWGQQLAAVEVLKVVVAIVLVPALV